MYGLEAWEFDGLATLRRAGPRYVRTPGDLIGDLMISSSSTTNQAARILAGLSADEQIALAALLQRLAMSLDG